ncbi:zinc ribbon domain-containing protein [Enterovibrio sp. ZSDZ42]|uniref:Zinc ribbon domain-containing protein n=1 Tax=Enterovibrio gelatinilyticus TaxID=2899819 RepID=A0ABT5QXG4_9GAMM|nr:zinc ribbon domain-containing protein [Enterovibrio sp. ZSDZ42]MDD1792713.1 zinc ribbon domain-containing protein [Enterovibrio sp. ZSDZ42]
MENNCPDCNELMGWDKGSYHCESCDKIFIKQGYCQVCDAQLEKLQACGATNYFCNQCNELKSRSSANIVFEAKKAVSS